MLNMLTCILTITCLLSLIATFVLAGQKQVLGALLSFIVMIVSFIAIVTIALCPSCF